MNGLDLTFLLFIAVVALQAFRKGFVKEFFGSIAFLVAFIIAIHFTYSLLHTYYSAEKPKATTLIAAYLLVFFAVYWGMSFTGKIVDSFLKGIQLGIANQIAGAAWGVVKAIFSISLILWFIDRTGFVSTSLKEGSYFYKQIKDFAPYIISLITDSIPILKGLMIKIEKSFPILQYEEKKEVSLTIYDTIAG
ncbi:MAG: CvpA family protein [Bacteroidetes bacterium]|nr:CvpA family protein [Bacteroidota bacterium]